MKKYDIIYADVPWRFKPWSDKGEGKAPPYPTMAFDDICALPVKEIAADNSILLLWSLWWAYELAPVLIKAWGFELKTCAFVWSKISANGKPRAMKGYYTRQSTEYCLLATRGKILDRHDRGVVQTIEAEVRAHSAKPKETYRRIDRLYPEWLHKNRIELFARSRWDTSWDVWGNEVDSDIDLDNLVS